VVCIEAQAAGKPVVGSRHCDIPFVVRDGDSGLLSGEGDTASMTRDLVRLAGDGDLRKRMGEYGRIHAAKQHDSAVQAALVADIYRSVLQRAASEDHRHG
jgi:glycosyltransferase involved in cell wall biosynthesis